ncbi:mitogen-activated protein kinase kinase kinase 3-like isoform X2 [Physella acuta]|uniref:mitogen-activated protein kinase kinase kinase 3-like isoform X2 n=1 Tax=Physella acuta TaxID=109671 RepID=UPI0027DB400C|nr:mitogen-activated protein kinase kinase kinase 3-like isoform X2 [Physella acuta]
MMDNENENVTSLAPEFPSLWERGRVVGKGTFGQVFIVKEQEADEEKYVGKEILVSSAKRDREMNIVELDVLMKIKHPKIVSFYGYEQKRFNIILFFENMSMGSIRGFIKDHGALPEERNRLYTKQILEGLQYLHERKPPIIHRDVKGDNVLLKDESNVKLTDFGLSKVIHSATNARSVNGTFHWMAPEVVTANEENPYDVKADIWSVGCTVVEMATTDPPFKDLSAVQVIMALSSKINPIYTLPASASNAMKQFLEQTFQINPASRPKAAELLGHSFVASV